MIIGIGGCSCSGKTSLARALAQVLRQAGKPTHIYHLDDYWVSEDLDYWEDPSCLRMDDFRADITSHGAFDVVIAEGFLVYELPRKLFAHAFFLDAPFETLENRRKTRTDWDGWVDPPGYFADVAYPAFLRWNAKVFAEKTQFHFIDGTLSFARALTAARAALRV